MLNLIKNEIIEDSNINKNRITAYIINGYMPYSSIAEENPDEGLKKYSDDKTWEQYKNGAISREEAIKIAIDIACKEIDKEKFEELKKLERIIAAPTISSFLIYIKWLKRQSGYGLTNDGDVYIELKANNKIYKNEQEYREQDYAISNVLNQCDSILKIICEHKEKSLSIGISDKPIPIWDKRNNDDVIGFGIATGAIPKFEHKGIGFGSLFEIMRNCGYMIKGGSNKEECNITIYK